MSVEIALWWATQNLNLFRSRTTCGRTQSCFDQEPAAFFKLQKDGSKSWLFPSHFFHAWYRFQFIDFIVRMP
jgi:hypothetical protein